MKHLKYLQTANDFEQFKNSANYILPNVSYIVETEGVSFEPIPSVEVGDICLANANGDKKFIKVGDAIPDGYEPIGVVVIPSSHDVYGTGECAVLSLKYMNDKTPDEGSISAQTIYWGGNGKNTSLRDDDVATIGSATAQTETVSFTASSYLPSDAFTATTCIKDTNAFYSSSERTAAPSPYLTDGSRNSQYYTTGYNALSDFDGVGNTNVLTGLATGQSDWKTATSITNNPESTYYPAACCCWRYSTVGTVQGDWYLPACGELGYVCARLKTINNAIQYLIDSGFSDSCSLVGSNFFWSSSENGGIYARRVGMDNGNVYSNYKRTSLYVRAFLRVKP